MKKYLITTVLALLLSVTGINNAMAHCRNCNFVAGAAIASAVIIGASMARQAYAAPVYYQQPSYYQPQAYYQPQPYYQPAPAYYQPPPQPVYRAPVQTVYVQQQERPRHNNHRLFCRSSSRYYPNTKHCPEGWMEVIPPRY